VEWDGKNIVVMKSVIINPPYSVTSCHGRNGDNHQAVEHVKKIVIHLYFFLIFIWFFVHHDDFHHDPISIDECAFNLATYRF
jgi:hypothetical protein